MGTARDIQRMKVYRWEWATEGRKENKLSRRQSIKYVSQMYGWHTTASIEESDIYTLLLEDYGELTKTTQGIREASRTINGETISLREMFELCQNVPSVVGKFYTREQAEKAREIILGLPHEDCTAYRGEGPLPHTLNKGAAVTVKPWAPAVSFNTRRSRVSGSASYNRTEIKLTDTKDVPIELWTVAHEVAHCVTPNEVCTDNGGAHGRLFMRHLIELLIRFKVTDMSLSELEASAKAAGVKVAPRTHSLRTKKRPKAQQAKSTVHEPVIVSGARS